jgi:hypothetical protein
MPAAESLGRLPFSLVTARPLVRPVLSDVASHDPAGRTAS